MDGGKGAERLKKNGRVKGRRVMRSQPERRGWKLQAPARRGGGSTGLATGPAIAGRQQQGNEFALANARAKRRDTVRRQLERGR